MHRAVPRNQGGGMKAVFRFFVVLSVVPLCVTGASINYQGRIAAGGSDYTGPAWIKARAISMFDENLWSNDGSAGTGEPSGSVQIEVNNGLFNIELGNPSIPGMTAMDWKVFRDSECSLRIWFSTNSTAYEQLSPDVSIRPATLEKLSSGRTVFVDDSDSADFNNLQDALNAVYNDEAESIIILPGWYPVTTPLTFSTQRFVSITGWGNRDEINIECTNGPAMYLQSARLENISVSGSPAISDNDPSVAASYWWQADHCVFRNNSAGAPEVPAMEFSGDGQAILFDCRIENQSANSGPALALGGNVDLAMSHCSLWSGSGGGSAALVKESPVMRAVNCDFFSDDNLSLLVTAPSSARFDVQDCRMHAGIYFSVTGGVNSAGGDFIQCGIGNENGADAAIHINGGCGWLNFDNCNIWTEDAHGIYQYSEWGYNTGVQMRNSSISVYDTGGDPGHGVFIGNSSLNDMGSASINLMNCRISAFSGRGIDSDYASVQLSDTHVQSFENYAINCSSSDLSVEHSDVRGNSGGILAAYSEIEISHSSIEGSEYGIYMGESMADVSSSMVVGGLNDGILAAGSGTNECELFITRSDITGSDSDEGALAGCAIRTDFTPETPMVIFHSTLDNFSEFPTLDLNGGMNIIEESIILTEAGPAVSITRPDLFIFEHTKFLNVGDGNTNALLLLCENDGEPIQPVVNGCVFRTLFGAAMAAVDMNPTCSATNSAIIMADCYLGNVTFNTNAIALVPVDDTTLPYGNIIGF